MFRHKTDNYEIVSSEKPISKQIISDCKKAYAINKKFFGQDCYFFTISITHSEEVFKKKKGKTYSPWAKGGLANEKKVVIRSQDEITRVYKMYPGESSFPRVITHEVNHIFEGCVAKGKPVFLKPNWLTEGLAGYVADNNYKAKKISKSKMAELFIFAYNQEAFDVHTVLRYSLFKEFTKYLIEHYSLKRMRMLISVMSATLTRANYDVYFKKIYGKSEKEMIEEFLATSF